MIQSSIYGRIGKDPKPGTTKNGNAMCTASIAVDVGREPGTETLWISVMCFGTLADTLQRHQSGDMIAAMGKLTRGHYTAADGTERESWSLMADALHSSRTVRPGQRRGAGESAGGGRDSGTRAGNTRPAGQTDRHEDQGGAGDGAPFDDQIPF
jgi:single-strand DNA-binding protein